MKQRRDVYIYYNDETKKGRIYQNILPQLNKNQELVNFTIYIKNFS